MEIIFKLLDSDDFKSEKAGLQKICELLELDYVFGEKEKQRLFRYLSKLHYSQDVYVRRWLYKTIALLKERSYAPYLKGQLKSEQDEENISWIIAALFGLLKIDEAEKITKSFNTGSSSFLASAYFQPSLLPKSQRSLTKVLDKNDTLSLKWLSLLYGNSFHKVNTDRGKLLDHITRLNLHDDSEVAEYSVWALHKSNDGSFSDSQITPQDIPSYPSNIRRWLYRLITKEFKYILIYYDFIEGIILSESDISAREGLAIGMGKFASEPQLCELILRWFEREKNQFVRQQLLISIADSIANREEYKQVLVDEVENPYDQISKAIALKGLSKLSPHKGLQTEIDFRPMKKLEETKFTVAFSFSGEYRDFVNETVEEMLAFLDKEEVFYDAFYKAQLAKPNIDTVLQNIYHKQTKLNVIFLCDSYREKEWTGIEWRVMKDLIKQKRDDQIMLFRFDDATIDGLLSIDGYIDLQGITPKNTASFIRQRLEDSLGHKFR